MNDSLEQYLADGGRIGSPENATPRYRGELMSIMAVFVDSEMAGASGFADIINFAPGVKERITASRIVNEKFRHAYRVLKIMESFGANIERYANQHPWASRLERKVNLSREKTGCDSRLNVFYYPLENWCDAVTMNALMGLATIIQIEELTHCSYQPLVNTMQTLLPTEARHCELGVIGLKQLLADDFSPVTAQKSVDYWYPRVADCFGDIASKRFELLHRLGLRQRTNGDLLSEWKTNAKDMLSDIGLEAPRLNK